MDCELKNCKYKKFIHDVNNMVAAVQTFAEIGAGKRNVIGDVDSKEIFSYILKSMSKYNKILNELRTDV